MEERGQPSVVWLSEENCIDALRACDIGRIATVHDGYPVVFPINYVVVTVSAETVVALRTRTGNVIDHTDELVALEIDSVDPGRDGGWSVLVRGRLLAVAPDSAFNSHPIISCDRDAWRIIDPHLITGRRVIAEPSTWAFDPQAYL